MAIQPKVMEYKDYKDLMNYLHLPTDNIKNLIPNIEAAWDEIGAFHLGDNPGRKEPTSGEINYKNIFKYIHERGFKGVLCMEHGKTEGGKEGDQKVINAYRHCDSF